MNISILAAGSGGMYCGSCMRDNALATALKRLGHSVTLIPLYTPLRTEETEEHGMSIGRIFYGGINVYLQHASGLFRHTPRFVDWLLDRPWLLNAAGRKGAQTSPAKLVSITRDIIEGDAGHTQKELHRLLKFLKADVRPQVLSLPNLMFIGMAAMFKRELGTPIVCELTGEDIFLDAMKPRDRETIRDAIRLRTADVDAFVATSDSYASRMAEYLDVPRARIEVVYPGITAEYLAEPPRAARAESSNGDGHRPLAVGYLARVCPEKGLDRLIDAMHLLHEMPGMSDVRLRAAGYVGTRDTPFYKELQRKVARSRLNGMVTFHGEVTRDEKLDLLDSVDVFSAPAAYAEPKGIFVLEALARGVPVVQPAHGAFPELIEKTGGGVLFPPGDVRALAEALAGLLRDEPLRRRLGQNGRQAVRAAFTDDHMAGKMLEIYERLLARGAVGSAAVETAGARSHA